MTGVIIFYIITALLVCATGVFILIDKGETGVSKYIITALVSILWFIVVVGAVIYSAINAFGKNHKDKTIQEELEEKIKEKLEQ